MGGKEEEEEVTEDSRFQLAFNLKCSWYRQVQMPSKRTTVEVSSFEEGQGFGNYSHEGQN